MAPPELMDDLVGEILLRLPPEDPECLVRASLVCKPWRRLLSDPSFPRRYREFHGVPPLLGFLHDEFYRKGSRFVPVKEACPIHPPPDPDRSILDCRHGRVLLLNSKPAGLILWDPITNSRQDLGWPNKMEYYFCFRAAVLCAFHGCGCDHLGCCGGPFLVVFLVIDFPSEMGGDDATARTYSSETGEWTTGVSSVHLGLPTLPSNKMIGSSLLASGALYFILQEGRRILKYDLAGYGMSVMSPPPCPVGNMVLLEAEGGSGLGACGVEGHNLHLWAWLTGPNGIPEWERGRVIQLDDIGGDLTTKLDVVDFAEGAGSIFIFANEGLFAVDLKSGRVRKIGNKGTVKAIFPFMSFYTPAETLFQYVAP